MVWEGRRLKAVPYPNLDDAYFHNAGFSEEETLHYYLTEEEGKPLYIFPINEKLRYLVPFAEPKETIDYLYSMATAESERVVVLADDGEKFGSWPGTAELVYDNQWLRRFFTLLEENSHWLNVTTCAEFLKERPPAGRVYLPAGSYREMMEWSGGFWRNFFIRYPESNQIHKRMLHVREKLELLPAGPQKEVAREYLWASQCNCAYWHGVFGGLYLNFLRSALYSRIIAAETVIDRFLHPQQSWLELEKKDFDYDGAEEVLVSGPELGFILSPAQGGSLLELDFKPLRFNLFDVLSRRREAYHCNIFELADGQTSGSETKTIHQITRVKEAGLEQLLIYDNYRRASLIDHFFPVDIRLEELLCGLGAVEVGDFAGSPYLLSSSEASGAARISLGRDGLVGMAGQVWPVRVEKTLTYLPQSGEIRYDYRLINSGESRLTVMFAVEFNINFLAGQAPDRYYSVPGVELNESNLSSSGELQQVEQIGLVDEWLGISTQFNFAQAVKLWRMPLETVSQSEDGMERVYQGSTLLPAWQLGLQPGEASSLSFVQKVFELKKGGELS
ncbi:MAG: Alpha-amylase 1 [Dehalococcoidia bacterium]|nr:Alpha-amylase 1 [Bacillota bacterium]